MQSPGHMQEWLDRLGANFFAALGIALQRDHAADVSIIINANRELFEGAAHIIAARHDFSAARKIAKDPSLERAGLLAGYASGFVDEFRQIIYEKSAEARWLALEPPESRLL